jgi:branched-chain amino acid transport system substrate-binding protein
MMSKPSRRRVLKGLAAATVATIPPRAFAQQTQSIKIGLLTDMNGPLSQMNGPGTSLAARMAVEAFTQAHPGIKVELEAADMQNKPDVVVSLAREWLDNKGFDVITDVPISAGALALAPLLVQRDKVGLFTSAQSTKLTGENCGTNHLQWVTDSYANSKSVVETQLQGDGKAWFFITGDTALGRDLQNTAAGFVTKGGGTVVGSVQHPYPGNTEFASYLLQAQASGAKIIGLANTGPDAVNCIKQAAEFGIIKKGQKIAGLALEITAVRSIGLDLAQGVLLSDAFYWDLSDKTRDFAQKFKARHGDIPTAQHAGQYSAVLNYLNAVAAIGVDQAKKSGRAVLKQMHSKTVDDALFGPLTVREDGRVIHQMLALQVKSPAQSTSKDDVYNVVAIISGDQSFRPIAEGGCTLVAK